MSASQRNKGASAEREVLRLLAGLLGVQSLERNLQQSRNGGADCLAVRGFAIEVKRQEALSRPAWWRQACSQAEALGLEPMLLYRRSREPWTAWFYAAGKPREGTLEEAAGVIRERWMQPVCT